MEGTISISSILKDLPDPVTGVFTIDAKSLNVDFNVCVFPGMKTNEVAGIKTTFGGFDALVHVNNHGVASLSGMFKILERSSTFEIGRKFSNKLSIGLQNNSHLTFVYISTVTEPKAIAFDEEDSKNNLAVSVTLMEDPHFKTAGKIFVLGIFTGWAQKLTFYSVRTFEEENCNDGSTRKAATLTNTLELSVRPVILPSCMPKLQPRCCEKNQNARTEPSD